MYLFRWILGVFWSLFRKAELDRELDRELDGFLAMVVDEKLRAGIPLSEALRQARVELGGSEQVKERVREGRMGAGLDTLIQDFRYSIRTLRRNAGLTGAAALILAIGIGANTALFGTVHSVLLRSLPFHEPQRLVVGLKTMDGEWSGSVSRVDYYDYRQRGSSFQELAALANFTIQHTVTGGGDPELIQASYVTWNLFPVLGVTPVEGRPFLLAEEAQGGASTTIISHGYWQRRFGGSPEAVGSTLTLDGQPQTIVGVMPPGFRFMYDADLWRLVHVDGPYDTQRDSHSHTLVGRLAEGVSLEQAQAEMDAISAALAAEYPESNTGKGLLLDGSLLFLMGTTVMVLLLACGNVAGLLLARGERRQPEIAMRTALGASRGRLLRQLLTESLILTLGAGVLGVGVALLLQDILLRLLPVGDLSLTPSTMNLMALGFTLLLSLSTGVLVGLVPATRSSSLEPARQLRSESRSSAGHRSTRIQSGLVIFQMALSVVLLIGSGLLIRSLAHLSTVELGFDRENLLTGQLQIQGSDYPTPAARNLFFSSLLEEVEALPGVEAATLANRLPILSRWQDWSIWPVGDPPASAREDITGMARWVPPGYFRTMGIPLLSGRDISDRDGPETPYVVVVSRSVAEAFFAGDDPIGQWMRIGDWRDCQVIGVVEDARVNTLRGDPDRAYYMAAAQMAPLMLQIAVRTSVDPELLIRPIQELLRRKDPNVLFAQPRSMASIVEENLAGFRTIILSLALFAAIAVLLAAIGIYGLLAYQVTQRKAELGLRLAIGASEPQLVRMILRRGLILVLMGLVAGLAVAYPGTLAARTLLYEVQLLDPTAYAAAVLNLVAVASLACYLPARRARQGDIVDALRRE
jgi:putative ABC transport system permease protein